VKIHVRSEDLAAEIGADIQSVEEVLARLRRLRIAADDEAGGLVLADLGRLLEFLEFLEMPKKFEGS
jgi:hypothetical protein